MSFSRFFKAVARKVVGRRTLSNLVLPHQSPIHDIAFLGQNINQGALCELRAHHTENFDSLTSGSVTCTHHTDTNWAGPYSIEQHGLCTGSVLARLREEKPWLFPNSEHQRGFNSGIYVHADENAKVIAEMISADRKENRVVGDIDTLMRKLAKDPHIGVECTPEDIEVEHVRMDVFLLSTVTNGTYEVLIRNSDVFVKTGFTILADKLVDISNNMDNWFSYILKGQNHDRCCDGLEPIDSLVTNDGSRITLAKFVNLSTEKKIDVLKDICETMAKAHHWNVGQLAELERVFDQEHEVLNKLSKGAQVCMNLINQEPRIKELAKANKCIVDYLESTLKSSSERPKNAPNVTIKVQEKGSSVGSENARSKQVETQSEPKLS